MVKKVNKRFVIRKYIYAASAKEAIKKDRSHPVEDVWVDDDWKKENMNSDSPIGFNK